MNRSTAAVEKWREIVDEQTSSGQTVAEYCRRRGIAASSLFYWKRRLKCVAGGATSAATASTFVEAKVRREDCVGNERGGEAFQSDASIEIHLPGQRRIIVRRGFDCEALKQAVMVLEGQPSKLETLA